MGLANKRREAEVFSLAFLDCICCGFGAVLLVFILTISQKQNVDKADVDDLADRVHQMAAKITLSEQDLDRLAKVLAAAQLELNDVNAKNNWGGTPAREGDVERIRAILKKEPELVFSEDATKKTPLHWAAAGGHLEVARLLISCCHRRKSYSNQPSLRKEP